MLIRPFLASDAEEVSQLIRETVKQVNSKDYDTKVIQKLVDEHSPEYLLNKSKTRTILVAEHQGRLIGVGALKDNCLRNMFVRVDMVGKGIGSKIIEELESLARKRGFTHIEANSSLTALGFYLDKGYEEIKTVDKHGFPLVLVRKKL